MHRMRKKNGFSLVEAVIALSMIVIVSVSAISVLLSSTATKTSAIRKSEAQRFADNVWECFKAAEDEAEFTSFVAFAETISLGEGVADEDGFTTYTYTSDNYQFTVEISVTYTETERPVLTVAVFDDDGNVIISFSYRKGGEI